MTEGAAHLPQTGDMIAGKYVVEHQLGRGGMGAVFAARHVKLGKPVAIKVMLADASNPEAAHRFINEGRAAANIQNEHVVRVDDVDEENGYAYMVLELLEGEDLAQVVDRRGALPAELAVAYVLQALRGVTQAHAIGIVHRDLKPSNLFLARKKDGSRVVKVLDFGISKAQGSSALLQSPNAMTSTKAMLGSPLYMSPEQLRSSKHVDQRADLWAMGVILYELVTGTLPFTGENLGELFAAILEQAPRPPGQLATLPPGLEAVILRCLERRPEQRFQSAAELAQALAPFAQDGDLSSTFVTGAAGATAALPPSARLDLGPASTPGPVREPSHPGIGVSSSADPVVAALRRGATVPLHGGSTPGPVVEPSAGWQTTGGSGARPSRTPLVAAAAGAGLLAMIGFAGIGYVVVNRAHPPAGAHGVGADPSTTASTTPRIESSAPVPVPPPEPATAAVATTAPIASTAPTTSANAATAAKTTPPRRPGVVTAPPSVAPPVTAIVPPAPPATPSATTHRPATTSEGLQNSR